MSDQKIKAAAGKVPLNLLPLRALKGVARVFGYGAKKYAAGNFLTASDDDIGNRYAGGLLRHLASAQRPDGLFDLASLAAFDDESGLPEIDHAICGLIMLRALLVKRGALAEDPGEGRDPIAAVECQTCDRPTPPTGPRFVVMAASDVPAGARAEWSRRREWCDFWVQDANTSEGGNFAPSDCPRNAHSEFAIVDTRPEEE